MENELSTAFTTFVQRSEIQQLAVENQRLFANLFVLGTSLVNAHGEKISRPAEFVVAMISGALFGSLFSAGLMAILLRARARINGREEFLTAGEMKLIGHTALGGAIIGGLFTGTYDATVGCPINEWTGMCAQS